MSVFICDMVDRQDALHIQHYFICDAETEKPDAPTTKPGDLCFVKNTSRLYFRNNANFLWLGVLDVRTL